MMLVVCCVSYVLCRVVVAVVCSWLCVLLLIVWCVMPVVVDSLARCVSVVDFFFVVGCGLS